MKLIYLGEELDVNKEHELLNQDQFGFKVIVKDNPKSENQIFYGIPKENHYNNVSEVHYKYTGFDNLDDKVAIESNYFATGSVRNISDIESIEIIKTNKYENTF